MRYQVGITIHNSFEVEADSKEQAEDKVREYTDDKILGDSDFTVTYTDEIKDEV
tara:strand:+ start:483 stop:644 length:162 start_codon:yes stop_codon:yes gene_type:complete